MVKSVQTAVVAAGCFWGVEELFRKQPGVLSTQVGYCGGNDLFMTYNEVKTGQTGHAEALLITYDPAVISYASILKFFFSIHDPTTVDKQGNDTGSQYRSALFYQNEDQRLIALDIINKVNQSGFWPSPVVTTVEKLWRFHVAEDYHQNYLQKNPTGYMCHYIRNIKYSF